MSDDTITIRGWVCTDRVGSKCEFEEEFDREDWVNMDIDARDEVMREAMWDSGMIEWGYEGE